MSWFAKLIAKLATSKIRGIIKGALVYTEVILRTIPEADVTAAKEKLKRAIQEQRKVPGELRRFACFEVDSVDASDVRDLLAKLQLAFD